MAHIAGRRGVLVDRFRDLARAPMTDRIDAFVSMAHYAEHLQPILDALPDDLRGELYAPSEVGRDIIGRWRQGHAPNSTMPLLVAGFQDTPWSHRPKVLVQHGAGQTYCLTPETRLLRSDLHWIPIADLVVGDELSGFEEEKTERRGRQWRRSFVLSTETITRPCYRLLLADGTKLVASADHLWLKRNCESYQWLSTERVRDRATHGKKATKLLRAFRPWEEDRSWGAAYLAAAFDGEGSFTQTRRDERQNRTMLTFTQKMNAMLAEVEAQLLDRGFDFSVSKARSDGVVHLNVLGGSAEVLRFLGSVRPRRLLANLRPFDGGQMRALPVEVLESEYIGDQEVVAIRTSARTFFAEGFASHNCGVEHGSYAGGPGHDMVQMFLCPNERTAALERAAYPNARVEVVGCPKLDAWSKIPKPHNAEPVVAVTFHWQAFLNDEAGRPVPEAGWAWETWRDRIGELARRLWPGRVLGHGHPRAQRWLRAWWDEIGVEFVPHADVLLAWADCLILDNSCVTPDTKVLCEDLVWRPAGALIPGDRVIACDEHHTRMQRRSSRQGEGPPIERDDKRLRTAVVTANELKWKRCFTVSTESGDVTVSQEHPWLARRPVRHDYLVNDRNGVKRDRQHSTHWHWEWVATKDLRVGDDVAFLVAPWEREDTREAGWLAGMFDGEGCLFVSKPSPGGSKACALSIAQNPGPTLEHIHDALSAYDLTLYQQKVAGATGHKRCVITTVQGTVADRLAFLGRVRPERLIDKAVEKQMWVGSTVSNQVSKARVAAITDAGWQRVSVLSTSERTFIAEGFIAHNSLGFEWAALDRPTVWLRSADWRPDDQTGHGLRFGEPLPGPEVWAAAPLDELVDAVNVSMHRFVLARAEVGHRVYGERIFGAAQRAADAVLSLLEEG